MITAATQGASGTPATTAYNTLAGLLTAAGWYETVNSPVPLATAGTTADVRVWGNSNTLPTMFILIEVDDVNSRLRFRTSEQFNKVQTATLASADVGDTFDLTYNGASTTTTIGTNCTAASLQSRLRALTGDSQLTVSGSTDTGPFTITFSNYLRNTAITAGTVVGMTVTMSYDAKVVYAANGVTINSVYAPNSNYALSESSYTIFQSQSVSQPVGWVNIQVSGGGFNYLAGVRNDQILYAASPGNHYVLAGILEPPAGSRELSVYPQSIYLASSSNNSDHSWTANGYSFVRTSREWGYSTSVAGTFCYFISVPWISGAMSNIGGTHITPHKWITNFILHPAMIHGSENGITSTTALRSFRGVLPGFKIEAETTPNPASILDTATVDGTTYYSVGGAGAAYAGVTSYVCLWVDGSRF